MRSKLTAVALVLSPIVAAACRIGYEEIDVRGQPGEAGAGGSDTGGSGGTAGDVSGGDGGSSGASTSGGSTSGGASGSGGTSSSGGTSASGGSSGKGGSGGSAGSSGKGGSGGSGGSSGCSPTNGSVEVCDGLDNDCANGADDGVTCPSGCTGIAFEGNGYQFCEAEIAWQTARTNCETQGLHLVKVDSDAENTFIATTMFGTGTAFVWLGGDDLTTAGSWHWHDGSLFWTGAGSGMAPPGVYENWYPGTPGGGNAHCLEMRDDYSWDDKQCSQGKRYVCELLYP